jgi:hypothetical protein
MLLFGARSTTALAAALLLTHSAHAERIDRVVAVVGDRVVTSWDLQLEAALAGHMPCPEPVLCDPERAPLDRLVDRALVRGLAADTATYRPGGEDLELRLATLRDSWERPEDYQLLLRSLGLEESDLSGLLYSRLVVENYVQRHVALPVYASGGSHAEYSARYQEWIEAQRGLVRIRLIEPSAEPGALEGS